MADEIVPQAGDVWERDDSFRWISKSGSDDAIWRDNQDKWGYIWGYREWFAGAVLVWRDGKPSPPSAPGDVIPVECAVMQLDQDTVGVGGHSLKTAKDSVAHCWTKPWKHITTVTINVPRALLSPAVLPNVTANE